MKLQQADWYHHLPAQGKEILQKLQSVGFTAYLVGGAVRDLLLGKIPQDFDYVTNATPEQIEKLFPKTLAVGKKFGIMVVVIDDFPSEVATFRKDGSYEDGRHPEEIFFATPEEDALRRDFTINGLFWDSQTKNIIDYVGGIDAISARKIQAIGNAEKRFQEDALRMLRALRFYSQLSKFHFTLDEEIRSGIVSLRENLRKVSKERITQEVQLILQSPKPSLALQEIINLSLWEIIFSFLPVAGEVLRAIDKIHASEECSNSSIWSLLLPSDLSVKDCTKNFILPRQTIEEITTIRELCKMIPLVEKLALPDLKNILSHPLFSEVENVLTASSKYLQELNFCLEKIVQFEKAGTLSPAELLSGSDLIKFGYKPGKQFQEILKAVRRAQLNEEISTADEAKDFVLKNYIFIQSIPR